MTVLFPASYTPCRLAVEHVGCHPCNCIPISHPYLPQRTYLSDRPVGLCTVAFSGDGESIQGRLLYSFTEAWLGTAGKIRGRRFQWIGLLLLSSLGQYIKAYMASA